MKRVLFSAILLLLTLSACEKEEDKARIEELGKQAANEFCNCFKNNSQDYCLEELTSKYNSSDYMNNKFIEAFNRQSSCGIKLEKIYIPQ